jgi:ABC-type Fe3+-siderophore transport system permease subunit
VLVVRKTVLFVGLIGIAAMAMLLALAHGSADIGMTEAINAVLGSGPEKTRSLVLDLRLPRALTAFSVGGLLAIAGVLMQVLLRNPLAEPYILGSSGGAAVAALLAMILGFGSIVIDLAAFGGAMAATLLVFSIAHGTGSWAPARLLLTGVVLAAGFSAATTLLLALSPDQNLRGRRIAGGHRRHASRRFSLHFVRGRVVSDSVIRDHGRCHRIHRPRRAASRTTHCRLGPSRRSAGFGAGRRQFARHR